MSDDIVSRAKALAIRAHAGQVDKAGRPYIEHVARVAAAVSNSDCGNSFCYRGWSYFGNSPSRCQECETAEAAAWLHDVIEDCADEFDREMDVNFSGNINLIVGYMTRDPSVSESEYYSMISKNRVARRVKLADIADNSSEERLALLDEKTAARLRRKYAKAISALTE